MGRAASGPSGIGWLGGGKPAQATTVKAHAARAAASNGFMIISVLKLRLARTAGLR